MQQELQFDFNSPLDLTKPFGSVRYGKAKEYFILPEWCKVDKYIRLRVLFESGNDSAFDESGRFNEINSKEENLYNIIEQPEVYWDCAADVPPGLVWLRHNAWNDGVRGLVTYLCDTWVVMANVHIYFRPHGNDKEKGINNYIHDYQYSIDNGATWHKPLKKLYYKALTGEKI